MKIFYNPQKNRFESFKSIPGSSFIFSKENNLWYSTDFEDIKNFIDLLSEEDKKILLNLLENNKKKIKKSSEKINNTEINDLENLFNSSNSSDSYIKNEEQEKEEKAIKQPDKPDSEKEKEVSLFDMEKRIEKLNKFLNLTRNSKKDFGKKEFLDYISAMYEKGIISENVYQKIKSEVEEIINTSDSEKSEDVLRKILMLPTKSLNLDIAKLKEIRNKLDEDLNGYELIKDGIIGYIATNINKQRKSPLNILLVGAPGVGKSTVAISLAKNLGLKLNTINLSNLSELDLPGSNRTWNNSTEGLIAKGLINNNDIKTAIFLLDEIDKSLSKANIQNIISSLLDPVVGFKDLFLDLELDISNCIFILTANDKSKIPDYILDRCMVFDVEMMDSTARKNLLRKKTSEIIMDNLNAEKSEADILSEYIVNEINEILDINISIRKFQIVLTSFIHGFIGYCIGSNQDLNLHEFYCYFQKNKHIFLQNLTVN